MDAMEILVFLDFSNVHFRLNILIVLVDEVEIVTPLFQGQNIFLLGTIHVYETLQVVDYIQLGHDSVMDNFCQEELASCSS